jgi:hypothetical protein
MVTGTDSVVLTLPITIYRANGTSVVVNKAQTITKSKTGAVGATGAGAVVAVLSNEAHVLPAATDGTVSSYVGSGTQVRVYEGATELQYDGSGLSNGTWTMSSVATNITRGGLTDSGSYLTVADHSTVATGVDASSIVYTLTGKSSLGVTFTITKAQSFSKSKIGATGSTGSTGSTGGTGPAGPTVVVTSDRPATFTATDGSLDAAQADLIFTATTQGLAGPTFAWTFSGLQTNPTASTTATQTITAAQFGSAKAAIVTCTVNSTYVDKITVVRLEKSTASAGATVNQTDAITNAAILAAQTAANNARGEADFAVTAINNIASDSKFTPTEKVFARTQWNIAVSEKVGINAQAALFLVTTENATYNTKFIDLGTYLNAGSTWSTGIPFWIRDAGLDDTETITGSLFRLAFTNFYDARTALLNKVAAAAVHAGNKITSGNVGTFIADAAISNTQIGGTIMSTTFVSGSAGWAINKAGSAEFSNAIFRGSLVGADITGATGTFSGTISAGSVNFASSVGTTTVYATPGTYTLTVPALMNSMKVTMWGAGGGGAGGGTWNYGAGTGGGKSTLATISLSGLTPGATFSITVGAGGSGGAAVPIGTTSSPGVTGNVGAPGGTSFLTGYGSSAGGSGGTTNNTSNPRNATSPYSGSGHSGTNGQGVGGGAGGIYEGYYFVSYNTDAGDNATGYGNGGGGGASGGNFGDGSTAGGAGSNGRVQVEFYDSAGVVLRPEMATLKTELRNQGLTIT